MIERRAGEGHNLEYKHGFQMEAKMIELYSGLIAEAVGVESIEPIVRGTLDMLSGIDALGRYRSGTITGISLRYRSDDYNSFTLRRHISDEASEVVKWINRKRDAIKPSHHVQIAEKANGHIRVIHVDIVAFSYYLERLIKEDRLSGLWNPYLKAYEFKLYESDTPAVRNEVIDTRRL